MALGPSTLSMRILTQPVTTYFSLRSRLQYRITSINLTRPLKTLLLVALLSIKTTVAFSQKSNGSDSDSSKSFTIGTIDELQSRELGEKRMVNLYLPIGYDKHDTTKYSVIYLLGGSADEDFIHVSGIVQFYSFPWINRVPKSIVVGIATVDRRRDFTYPTTIQTDKERYPTPGPSDRFIKFIEKELQPFIEKRYKTTASKTIIGQSLGGLLATEILVKKPELFNTYILISPSLWWDNGSLLISSPDRLNSCKKGLYYVSSKGDKGLLNLTNFTGF